MKKIILTGGGTAGHVNPNLALVPSLAVLGYEIHYVGGKDGVERGLATAAGLDYHGISAGKLRRYMSVKNFSDVFRILRGIFEALRVVRRVKPDVIFSKGGFVSVPVVAAGWMSGVPVVIHESDMTRGLANVLSLPFAVAVCCTFEETLKTLPAGKSHHTGAPIREGLFGGDAPTGLGICGFDGSKPVVLAMGGSSGSVRLNRALREALPELFGSFHVAHICGSGNTDGAYAADGYAQFEYASDELPHLLAAASVVVSRAGSNSITEFLALAKPSLLIPLPLSASRGDQIKNAESFSKRGYARMLPEEELETGRLVAEINKLYSERGTYVKNMSESGVVNGTEAIVRIICEAAESRGPRRDKK